MKNYAFYFSGSGTRVRKLIQSNYLKKDNFKFLITDSKAAHEHIDFKEYNLSFVDFEKLEGSLDEKNLQLSNRLLEYFKFNNIEYVFCWGDHILKGTLIREYKNRIINFHPSILPFLKGRKAVDKALNQKSFLCGNTAHFIDDGVDTGPIIMQSICHLNTKFENGAYDAVLDIQLEMTKKIINWIELDLLEICNEKVIVKGEDYNKVLSIP